MDSLDPSIMDPSQRKREGTNYDKVISSKDVIFSASSLQELKELAQKHLKDLFNPDRILLTEKNDPEFNGLNELLETSLRENRCIYIPNLESSEVFFNGQIPGELDDLFSENLDYFKIDSSVLGALPFGSVVASPLVSGLDRKMPVDQYKRHGIIVLCAKRKDMLDPLSDMGPLGMYTEYLAVALASMKK